jgi:hypothetical protein
MLAAMSEVGFDFCASRVFSPCFCNIQTDRAIYTLDVSGLDWRLYISTSSINSFLRLVELIVSCI